MQIDIKRETTQVSCNWLKTPLMESLDWLPSTPKQNRWSYLVFHTKRGQVGKPCSIYFNYVIYRPRLEQQSGISTHYRDIYLGWESGKKITRFLIAVINLTMCTKQEWHPGSCHPGSVMSSCAEGKNANVPGTGQLLYHRLVPSMARWGQPCSDIVLDGRSAPKVKVFMAQESYRDKWDPIWPKYCM